MIGLPVDALDSTARAPRFAELVADAVGGVGSGRTATAVVTPAGRGQQLLEPLADEPTATDRTGEQVGTACVVRLAVVELLEFLAGRAVGRVAAPPVQAGGGPSAGRDDLFGSENTEIC